MNFAFKKKNYILLIVGLVFIASGLILMIGGGSDDPTKFSPDIFNFIRIVVVAAQLESPQYQLRT